MKYHGQELKEFKSDVPVAFDPPKKMLCWDVDDGSELTDSYFKLVDLFLPAGYDSLHSRAVTVHKNSWCHCAEIPEGEKLMSRETNFFVLKNRDLYDKLVKTRDSWLSYKSKLDLLHEEDWQKAFCDELDLYDKLKSDEIDEAEYLKCTDMLGQDIYLPHEQEELDILKEELDKAEQEAGYCKPVLTLNLNLEEDMTFEDNDSVQKFYQSIKPSSLTEHAMNFFLDLDLKDGQILVAEQSR